MLFLDQDVGVGVGVVLCRCRLPVAGNVVDVRPLQHMSGYTYFPVIYSTGEYTYAVGVRYIDRELFSRTESFA